MEKDYILLLNLLTVFFDQHGYGLYAVDDSGVSQVGSGTLFGKNSPFYKIPLVGNLVGAIL